MYRFPWVGARLADGLTKTRDGFCLVARALLAARAVPAVDTYLDAVPWRGRG